MRERDLERAEVARMAAQADEATRAAQDMRMQLDQVSFLLIILYCLLRVSYCQIPQIIPLLGFIDDLHIYFSYF